MKNVASMNNIDRWLLVAGALVLLAVIKVPMWRIDLNAPQYPEGLKLFIYSDRLGGDVAIINGLNHYIGMKSLHTEDFFEFKILVPVIVVFVVFLLLTAVTAKRWMLQAVSVMFVLFGIIALGDFWRWEYNYGHNLNPDAAIVVPGMAYQPPLIGFKQLLNFGAYSIPALGGFLFAGVGVLLVAINFLEIRIKKRTLKKIKTSAGARVALALLVLTVFFITSCNMSTTPIILGKDNCSYCKMPFGDARFGAEIVTATGKVYKFDDARCLRTYLSENGKQTGKRKIYFVDFSGSHGFVEEGKACYLKSDAFRTPMNGNIAAFQSEDSLLQARQKFGGNKMTLTQVIQ